MKKVNYIVAGITLLLIVVFSSVEPRHPKAPPAYNAAAEVAVNGVVQETREFFCPVSDDQEIHLVLRAGDQDLMVHSGPARFLRSQEVHFSNGDQVKVIGSRVVFQGQEALLAREITRGTEVVILRDHQGQAIWKK